MESRISLNDVRGCLKYRAALYRLGCMFRASSIEHIKTISDACDIGITLGIRAAHERGAIGRGGAA